MQSSIPQDDIFVGRIVPSEYTVVLNAMPREWFAPEPHLMHLQVADMFNSNRFLVAQVGSRIAGGVGWQENIAFGAYYAKFIFVTPHFRGTAVAARLMREVISLAVQSGQRAVFQDIPEDSPLREVADRVPGAKEMGYIDDFHEDGVRSVIVAFDLKQHQRLLREAERRIKDPHRTATDDAL